jgi:hypothetical protein
MPSLDPLLQSSPWAHDSTLASSTFYITTPPSPSRSTPASSTFYITTPPSPSRSTPASSTFYITTTPSYATSDRRLYTVLFYIHTPISVVNYTHTLSSPTRSPTRPPSPLTGVYRDGRHTMPAISPYPSDHRPATPIRPTLFHPLRNASIVS